MVRRADIADRLSKVIAYREPEMAAALGMSAIKYRQLVKAGLMPRARLVGGIRLYDFEEAKARFREMPFEGEDQTSPWDEVLPP
jgi:hypothetical protein